MSNFMFRAKYEKDINKLMYYVMNIFSDKRQTG